MQNYKSLCAAVTICPTRTHIHADSILTSLYKMLSQLQWLRGNFHLGDIAKGVWETEVPQWVQGRSPLRWKQFADIVYRF